MPSHSKVQNLKIDFENLDTFIEIQSLLVIEIEYLKKLFFISKCFIFLNTQ